MGLKNLTTNINNNAVKNIILAKKKKNEAPSSTLVIKLLTVIVNVFPIAIDSIKNPITSDFIVLGAWVYENSRHVIDISTSAAVRIAYAKTCHAIDGVWPKSIRFCKYPMIKKEGTVRNNPIFIYLNLDFWYFCIPCWCKIW